MGHVEGQGRMGNCEMDGDDEDFTVKFEQITKNRASELVTN